MERTELVLVNPGSRTQVYGKLGSTLAGIEPPLWAALIAAFVRRHGFSVKIIDAEAEKIQVLSHRNRSGVGLFSFNGYIRLFLPGYNLKFCDVH